MQSRVDHDWQVATCKHRTQFLLGLHGLEKKVRSMNSPDVSAYKQISGFGSQDVVIWHGLRFHNGIITLT